jgi:protein O-mannosyl-transferase
MKPRVIYRHRPAFRQPLTVETDQHSRTAGWMPMLREIGIPLLLFLVPMVVLWPVLSAGFVSDDFFYHQFFKFNLNDYIQQLALIHNGELGFPYTFFRPATLISFKLDYLIWGADPVGFHLTNILLHSLNAVLFYRLLRLTGFNILSATAGALLFSLYPSNPEAVTWISGRFDVMALTWFLASLLCWCYARLYNNNRWLVGSLVAFLISMLAKESAAAGLLIFPIIDWLINIESRRDRGQGIGFHWKWYIILFATAFALFGFRIWLFRGLGGYSDEHLQSSYLSLAPNTMLSNLFHSDLLMLFTPVNRLLWLNWSPTFHYILIASGVLIGLCLILSLIYAIILLRKIDEVACVRILISIIWIFAFLLPTLPVAGVTSALDFSRFLYIPAIGLTIWMATTVELSLIDDKFRTISISMLLAVILIVFAVTLHLQNNAWLSAGQIATEINASMAVNTENLPDDSDIFIINFPLLMDGAHCAPLEYGSYLEFLNGTVNVKTIIVNMESDGIVPWWEDILKRWDHPGIGFIWDPSSRSILTLPRIKSPENKNQPASN